MKFRRFCTVFLLLALLLTQLWPVTAYAVEDIQLDAKAALLVDGATGTVLLDQDAHTKQYPASITKVMTALLGGSTGSRLFTNVRERLGCCYYCGARVNLLTGILLIECGLEEANRERLQSAILAEIADPAAGHITPQELSHIKLAFQSSLCSIGDSLARTEGWYLSGLLQGDPITPQQDMEEIASITAEEVAAAAAVLTLDTVFFLQAVGKENGCDED